MLEPQIVKLQADIIALETLTVQLFKILTASVPNADLKAMADRLLAGAEAQTIPGADPAYAELYTAELKESLERLLSRIQSGRPTP